MKNYWKTCLADFVLVALVILCAALVAADII